MKCNRLLLLLAAEAVLCATAAIFSRQLAGLFPALLSFPFAQIGMGLRALSLSGVAGNAAAIVLYILCCFLPLILLLIFGWGRRLHGEDALLFLLSAVLFPALYLLINPGTMSAGPSLYGGALIGGVLYSILLAWAVLRILRYFSLADLPRLHRCVSILLAALSIYFVYAIFGAGLSDLLKGFQDLSASNQGSEWFGVDLTLTQGFLVLNFLLSVLPYVLNLFLVFSARQLLSALRRDRYSEESAAGAKRLSSLCRRTLSVSILGIAAGNLLQFAFSDSLLVIRGTVSFPLFSIAFVLSILLFSRFLEENRRLKEDNDLFI